MEIEFTTVALQSYACLFPCATTASFINILLEYKSPFETIFAYIPGISRLAPPSGTKGFGGTEGFMAPEIMRYNGEEEYTEKVNECSCIKHFNPNTSINLLPYEGNPTNLMIKKSGDTDWSCSFESILYKIKLNHWMAKESKKLVPCAICIAHGKGVSDAILRLFCCISIFAISITFTTNLKSR